MNEKMALQNAARDLVLDHLIADDPDPASLPNEKLAQLYDEIMATPSVTQVKEAELKKAAENPVVRDGVKAAELDLLGRVAAHSYVQTYLGGLQKLGAGLEGLKNKVLGTTAEERLARERARREQEIALRPPEISIGLGERGASGTLDTELGLQRIGLREAGQKQELANQLRKLQLRDQYARRDREQALYNALHGEREIGGPLGHMAGGAALAQIAKTVTGRVPAAATTTFGKIMQTAPALRAGAGAGLGLYLARKLLTNPNPASRSVTRLERERYLPGAMTGDVTP